MFNTGQKARIVRKLEGLVTQAGTDRRVLRTRRLLSEALIELMQEKRYERITVQNIVDRANVGRSTFYAHYKDKDDLLLNDFEHVLDMLNRHVDLDDVEGLPISTGLFQHIQEHHHLYRALLWGRGIELLFEQGQVSLADRIRGHLEDHLPDGFDPPVPVPLTAAYLAGTLLTLVKWWLENDMPYPPAAMDRMYRQLALPGVMSVLEVSEPDI